MPDCIDEKSNGFVARNYRESIYNDDRNNTCWRSDLHLSRWYQNKTLAIVDHFKWLRISTYLTFHSNIFPRFWHTNRENAVTHEQSLNESIGMNAEYKRFVEWGELNKNMEYTFQWLSKNEAHIFNRTNISVVYITFSFCHIHSNAIHMREKRVEECKHFT